MKNLMVDNIMTGCDSETGCVEYFNESRKVMTEANMNLRQWSSNSHVLNDIANKQKLNGLSKVTVFGYTGDNCCKSILTKTMEREVGLGYTSDGGTGC